MTRNHLEANRVVIRPIALIVIALRLPSTFKLTTTNTNMDIGALNSFAIPFCSFDLRPAASHHAPNARVFVYCHDKRVCAVSPFHFGSNKRSGWLWCTFPKIGRETARCAIASATHSMRGMVALRTTQSHNILSWSGSVDCVRSVCCRRRRMTGQKNGRHPVNGFVRFRMWRAG